MNARWLNIVALTAAAAGTTLVAVGNIDHDQSTQLLNVSYDPTRELFVELNRQFVAKYENETGRKLTIKQSHGGSSRQARAVARSSWKKRSCIRRRLRPCAEPMNCKRTAGRELGIER
jgi:sulfate transport system substrate-binding protein